jgi:hypothetical protein
MAEPMEHRSDGQPDEVERLLDEELAGTFPASDPPSLIQPRSSASPRRDEPCPEPGHRGRGLLHGIADAITRVIHRFRGSSSG